MAEIVLAIGSSHSPALNLTVEDYADYAERDRLNRRLLSRTGEPRSYEALLAEAPPDIDRQISTAVIAERVNRCRAALDRLAAAIADARLDALVVIGDDQKEQYHEDNMPAILVYRGETIRNAALSLPDDAPAFWRRARAQFHEPGPARDYPVAAGLGLHLVEYLMDHDFDVSDATRLAGERGEGHAFGFVHRRLMDGATVPIIPVVLNTYYPPNQPRPRRCYALGRAIRNAVESWWEPARVGIVASGGLSHFTVDEDLDRAVLQACLDKDAETLSSLPLARLNGGNSEIRNWIAAAGAAEALALAWHDYVPCYRSPAGTGCGMAFAIWSNEAAP